MKSFSLIGFLAVLLFSGCSNEFNSANDNRLRNKSFVHLFFETEEDCLAAQPEPDFFINCHQQIDFMENNEVNLMLSDIIWQGTYQVDKNVVWLHFEDNYEVPEGFLAFEIIKGNSLRRLDNNTMWKKLEGTSIWE